MKRIKLSLNHSLIITFLVFLTVTLKGNGKIIHTCRYDINSLPLREKNGKYSVITEGGILSQKSRGEKIPADVVRILLPSGCKADSIKYEVYNSDTIIGEFNSEAEDNGDCFYFTEEIVKLEGNYYFSGNPITHLGVQPVKFIGENMLLYYREIKIEIFYSKNFKPASNRKWVSTRAERIISKSLEKIVANKNSLNDFQKSYNDENPNQSYYSYVIITSDSLKDSFQPLIHWLTRKGIRVGLWTVDSIEDNYSYDPISKIYDTQGAIRGFLMDEYEEGVNWVLLGGDEDVIPIRYGSAKINNGNVDEQPPSDLYYSDLNGNWNVDNDEYYGEPSQDSIDPYPEVFVGRVPASEPAEVSSWIEKLLSYELNPGNGNYDYLEKVFWTGADELRYAPGYVIEYGDYPGGFVHDTTMLEDSNGWYPYGEQVLDRMNNNYGWFCFYGHGQVDQVVVSAPGYNNYGARKFLVSNDSCDAFHYSQHGGCIVEYGNGIDSLDNKNHYGIFYISSCFQGAIDHDKFDRFDHYCGPSLAEAWTLHPGRGGPVFMGFTRGTELSTAIHFDYLELVFTDSILNAGVSQSLAKASNYSHRTWLSHTLFGEPEMPVWPGIPEIMSVSFIQIIPPEQFYFKVSVKDEGAHLENAYVCLWKEGEVYSRGYTDGNGAILFNIQPETEGPMLLTVTKDCYLPYLDTVWVDSTGGYVPLNPSDEIPVCRIDNTIMGDEFDINFSIPGKGKVILDLYDITGRKILRLIDGVFSGGSHKLMRGCSGGGKNKISSGVYFYRFKFKEFNIADKFILIK